MDLKPTVLKTQAPNTNPNPNPEDDQIANELDRIFRRSFLISNLLDISTAITVYNILTIELIREFKYISENDLHQKIVDTKLAGKSHRHKTENSIISLIKHDLVKPHYSDKCDCEYTLSYKGVQMFRMKK